MGTFCNRISGRDRVTARNKRINKKLCLSSNHSWPLLNQFSISVAAFGFCEYKEPESTLRSLRLLHDLPIGEKNLLVKVDAKTKAQLDEWKANRKTANGVRFSIHC